MYYTIDLGTDVPMECHVFAEFDGPATSLYTIIDLNLQGAATVFKKPLTGKYNLALDSGMLGETPYLLLDTLYNVGEGDQKQAGTMKALSASTGESLQICVHNELGYRETFLSAFESFISAFTENRSNPYFFETIYKMSFNNMTIGYALERYRTDSDGDISIVDESAILVPVDASSTSRSDTVGTEWSSPDGYIINATTYTIENGTLSAQTSLDYTDDKWVVSGVMQGKEINATLEHSERLTSAFGSYLKVKELLSSDQETLTVPMWAPEADPGKVINVELKKINDDSNANLSLKIGPITMNTQVNDAGMMQQGLIKQGGFDILMELMYQKGQPVLPTPVVAAEVSDQK